MVGGIRMSVPRMYPIQLTIGKLTYEFEEYQMLMMGVASRDGHKMMDYAVRVYDSMGRLYKYDGQVKEKSYGPSS